MQTKRDQSAIKSTKKLGLSNLINQNNKYFTHLIKHQYKYIFSLLITILLIPLIVNFMIGKPVIMGEESYYHLSSDNQVNPLTMIVSFIPEPLIIFLPFLIAILTIAALFYLGRKLKLEERYLFFFLLLIILSPTFIFSFSTISSYTLFFLLALLGFILTLQRSKAKYFSLIFFAAATFFDTLSIMLLLFFQIVFFLSKKEMNKIYSFIALGITVVLLFFNKVAFKLPTAVGPFYPKNILPNLVSDLGGISGVGFFIILLAVIGLIITWKRKNFISAYILLPGAILAYIYNNGTIFFISLVIIFFAAIGFVNLLDRKWTLDSLKKFTLLLLLLGILFSTLTYLDRIPGHGPSADDREALTWIKINTLPDIVVLSAPENNYFIKYFTERETVDFSSDQDPSQRIFLSEYIQELFPLLEKNRISVIYLNKEMKKNLPKKQGFLFLLKNERFKLIHSQGDSEVWSFEKDATQTTG